MAAMPPASRLITVTGAWMLRPDAEALYAADGYFWEHYVPQLRHRCPGFWWTCDAAAAAREPGLRLIPGSEGSGYLREPGRINLGSGAGKNSVVQAMSLALNHYQARSLVLLGVDLQLVRGVRHSFGGYPATPEFQREGDYSAFRREIELLVADLAGEGIHCVNFSPYSRIKGCLGSLEELILATALRRRNA
jgi:hypothetical protein